MRYMYDNAKTFLKTINLEVLITMYYLFSNVSRLLVAWKSILNKTLEPGFPRQIAVETARKWMHKLGLRW